MTTQVLPIYNDIIKAENNTVIATRVTLKGIDDNIPPALNILLQLRSYTGLAPDINTPEGEFHSYCWYKYYDTFFSFRACFILYEKGYYLESAIILRSLLEWFIQMRYLYKHKNEIKNVWTGGIIKNNQNKRITFKTMFDDISPGYYEKYYGRQFSGFAHGGISTLVLNTKFVSSNPPQLEEKPLFDTDHASYVINNFVIILLGYLNFFPVFFPNGYDSLPNNFRCQYQKSTKWLQSCISSHKKANPKSAIWYELIEKIIN